jgi:FkbM family methyltransferase
MNVPQLLRAINARLITVESPVAEKLLKTCFAFSVFLYRRAGKMKPGPEAITRIDNFDGSIRMSVDRSRFIGASLYWTGFHEFREFIFLHRFLKPDMVFADVGANQGEYSLFAAKRLSSGRVLAFEPLPVIIAQLQGNIRLNGFTNVQVFEAGLSDAPGQVAIHELEGDNEGLATLHPGGRKPVSSTHISLETLDRVAEAEGLRRLDFVKIDIEGEELKALHGSRAVIQKYRPVFMIEINRTTFEAAGYAVRDISDFFREAGYAAYKIGKRGALEPCAALPDFANIIFRPQ